MSSLGEILRTTRISKNLTLSQVKKATHIREHVLNAIENDDRQIFHSEAQLRGFIKLYSEYLGLDRDVIFEEYITGVSVKPNTVPSQTTIQPPTAHSSDEKSDLSAKYPSEDHRLIYQQISQIFTERRKALHLTLAEVEHYSHIRKRNVELIEKGDLDSFGSSVQLRGLLSTYTDFLELDRELILTLFAEALLVKRQSHLTPKTALVNANLPFDVPLWARQIFSMDLVFGLSMVGALLALAFWGGYTIINNSNAEATENPSISDVLLEQPTAVNLDEIIVTSPPIEETTIAIAVNESTSTAIPTTINLSPVNITIIVLEKALLRVTVDGKVELSTRSIPGSVLDFNGTNSIEILTGSASSIKVIYNQQELGTLGEFGTSTIRIFGPSSEITATPSITPTPTITPRPSRTPIPTKTTAP